MTQVTHRQAPPGAQASPSGGVSPAGGQAERPTWILGMGNSLWEMLCSGAGCEQVAGTVLFGPPRVRSRPEGGAVEWK